MTQRGACSRSTRRSWFGGRSESPNNASTVPAGTPRAGACPRRSLGRRRVPGSFEHHHQHGCSPRWLPENTCRRRPSPRCRHESLQTLANELQLCGHALSALLRGKVPTGLGGATGTPQMPTGAGKDIGPGLGLGAATSPSSLRQAWCFRKVCPAFRYILLALSLRQTCAVMPCSSELSGSEVAHTRPWHPNCRISLARGARRPR